MKTKSLFFAIVWQATPHLASFACGGWSAVVAGVNVSLAGSYLNAPMTPDEAPYAYAAAQKAVSMRAKATAKERALIDAVAVRYVEKFDAAKRVEQDRAYIVQ